MICSRRVAIVLAAPLALSLSLTALRAIADEFALTVQERSSGLMRTFTVTELEKLPTSDLQTATPWTDKRTRFEGTLLRDLLKSLDASYSDIIVNAYNDYSAKIPARDLENIDVIIAWRADGRRLSLIDKGPFWIIYPLDDLGPDASRHLHKMVWQVRSIELVRQ